MSAHSSAYHLLSEHPSGTPIALAELYDLKRIIISIIRGEQGKELTFSIAPNAKYLVVVLEGDGQVNGIISEHGAAEKLSVAVLDCFGWKPAEKPRTFSVVGGQQGVTLLYFSDIGASTQKTVESPAAVPQILNAYKEVRWNGYPGTKSTNLAGIGRILNLAPTIDPTPWNVSFEVSSPGSKSSDCHAHALEDEFVFIVKGKARYWNHGVNIELGAGDCVGWKAGTGIAHNLINDGEGPNGEGADLAFLIFGENYPHDKLFYPDLPNNCKEERKWVIGRPEVPWGDAEKEPKYPRVDEDDAKSA